MNQRSTVILILTILGSLGGIIAAAPTWESLLTPQAFGGAILVLTSTVSAAFGVQTKTQDRRRRGTAAAVGTLGIAAVLLLSGCGTQVSQVVQKIELQPVDCAAITSPATANDALIRAQVVRIAGRDLVAALYPSVMNADAVRAYDEKIDRPFTEAYARARELVDAGLLDGFKAMCDQLAGALDALLPVINGGVQ